MSELIDMYVYCCETRDAYAAAPPSEENIANAMMCDILARAYASEIEVMMNDTEG